MAKKWIILILGLFFLVSCNYPQSKVNLLPIFSPENELSPQVKKIKLKVKLSSKEYQDKGKDIFWEKALEKGMQKINREILKKNLFVSPTKKTVMINNFLSKRGEINPIQNPYTKDLEQEFELTLEITPEYNLAGKVISLKENSFAIGTHDFCYIGLFAAYSPSEVEDKYFLIGKYSKEEGIVRITGMGKITQALVKNKERTGYSLLAQGELYEVKEEVELDDLIFLPKLSLVAISQPALQPQNNLQPEVVVEPRYLDELKEPAEAK